MSHIIPVLIVGAGPTGLNLANLLTSYGIDYRIIDQNAEPIQTSNALAVQARSLEMWDSFGIAEQAIARGKKIIGLSLNNLEGEIGQISFKGAGIETKFPFILGLPQAETELLLAENLEKQGIKIERSLALIDFIQHETFITAEVQHKNGEKQTIECEWLIACDGCHSTVRKKLNLDFKGETIPEKFIMMDAELEIDFDPDYFHAILSPYGPLVFASMGKFTRIICTVTHDTKIKDFSHPTVDDFQYVIKERCRSRVEIKKVNWISHFMTHHRLIDDYRHGRIFLAGDSAHIHSPVGGQGMNTGMQDTYNLAWKLALVIKGKSQENILNSYSLERRSVAEKILSGTTGMTHLVTVSNPLLISLRNTLLSYSLRRKFIQKILLKNVSELSIHYKPNTFIFNNGRRAPDVLLKTMDKKEISLRKLFRGLNHQLLIFAEKESKQSENKILEIINWINTHSLDWITPVIITDSDTATVFNDYLIDDSLSAHHHYSLESGGVCLVRPDQYIAFSDSNLNTDLLSRYVSAITKKGQ